MDDQRISKEQKLQVAKDIVSSYLRGDGGKNVTPDQLGPLFNQVFQSIDSAMPEPEKRRIGLGLD
jgi:hypothetical protein